MKALDKVFDTQVITGIIGDRISFHWSKENFLYERERKQTRKDGIKKSYNRYRRKSTNLSKSKWMEHWTMYQVTNYDSIDFENLTGKFWIKNMEVIIILRVEFKSRWN